jgi:membrane fusion protein (multidrug efflux system)
MNRLLAPRSAFALTSLLALWGAAACHHEEHVEVEAGEFQITSPLRTDTELTSEYVCQVRSIQHIEVRALERGYLQEVFVDEGKSVKQGDQMFQILPTLYQAELDKAQAEADFAQIEYDNTKLLADRDVVSDKELALAKARLDKAKAEVDLKRVHLGFTEVRAPFDGIMDRLEVRKGSLLDEGELLTTLSDNSKMWVYFNVTEAEYLDYKTRSENPDVRLVMANGKVFDQPGVVETIEADFHNETGTIAFRATFPNPDGLLRHGQTGKVLMTRKVENALLVPQKATFEILDRKFVFVVDEDQTVRSREITVAEELPHLYLVASGVDEGEKILLEGLRKVQEGDEIAVNYLEPAEVVAHLEVPAE